MLQPQLLKSTIAALATAKVDYMITGSIASSIYGPPRLTYDIDIVIAMTSDDVDSLLSAFPGSRYYYDRDTILDAIRNKSEFNIIDSEEGGKIDFWILADDPYNRTRFSRKRRVTFQDIDFPIAGPEDVILMKLKWAVMSGGSEKQFQDALGVFENMYHSLDRGYLDTWAGKLEINDMYRQLKERARIVPDTR